MRMYKVTIADKLTKWPLATYKIKALNKQHAKRKVFVQICKRDKSYLITASKC